jgi:outer membrane receptor protein involved in Fe transport
MSINQALAKSAVSALGRNQVMNSVPATLRFATGLLLAAGIVAPPAVAQAQQNQEGQQSRRGAALEEIVVTARRRNESLMDIPTAVTAFSFDEMDAGS